MVSSLTAIVLAAGKGTRMKSELPKVLHPLAGKAMINHVLDAVRQVGAARTVVVIGHGGEEVRSALGSDLEFARQDQQLGTGHAVIQALTVLPEATGDVLVVCGDTPLLRPETLSGLLSRHRETASVCTVLSARMPQPFGYGRIIRAADGRVERIVEEKDATPAERRVEEINTGSYCFDLQWLRAAMADLKPDNSQGEYYLTDSLAYFNRRQLPVQAYVAEDPQETMGINDRVQLAEAEGVLRRRVAVALMLQGVSIVDPANTYIDAQVEIGPDTVIQPFTMIRGRTRIGSGAVIGPHAEISDSILGDRVRFARSVMVDSTAGPDCNIGPFAYLRPGTALEQGVKIGDFVEVKKSRIGRGSKVPHLSYVGDATVGEGANIGCGTITCNYDGRNKYQTTIGDGAFIGSNTNLVAPVTVGQGAVIGAGSTITKDVGEYDLAIGRGRQVNLKGRARNRFEKDDAAREADKG